MGVVEEVGAESRRSRRATASSSPSRCAAAPAGCASTACRASARRPRCGPRARVRRCSATPSSTARCPVGRPSTSASPCPVHPRQGPRRPARRPLRLPVRRPSRPRGRPWRTPTPNPPDAARAGPGPIGDMACRIALHRGVSPGLGVDRVPARLDRARARGRDHHRPRDVGRDVGDAVRDVTGGRGADAVIDAVGMEAHGSPVVETTPARSWPPCPTPSASGS